MKQMVNKEAPFFANTIFGRIVRGFFRIRQDGGEIFYAISKGGKPVPFPVREDGLISNHLKGVDIPPDRDIELITPQHLGISEIKWAND